MRIIAQDGCDYPYESIVISHDDGIIYARPISNMDKRYLIAQYSTREKAEKAMQKLHKYYTGALFLQNIDIDEDEAKKLKNMRYDFLCVNTGENNVRIESSHKVFRFPQEDEI